MRLLCPDYTWFQLEGGSAETHAMRLYMEARISLKQPYALSNCTVKSFIW